MPRRTGRPPGLKTDGPKIRRLRTEAGLTMRQLADQISVNQESVRRAEKGGPVGGVTTARLARALGVSMRDISNWPGDDDDMSDAETKVPA
jgi:transcriptional regulator with XRE-family HTH domain